MKQFVLLIIAVVWIGIAFATHVFGSDVVTRGAKDRLERQLYNVEQTIVNTTSIREDSLDGALILTDLTITERQAQRAIIMVTGQDTTAIDAEIAQLQAKKTRFTDLKAQIQALPAPVVP